VVPPFSGHHLGFGIWSREQKLVGVVSKADDDCKDVGPAIYAAFSSDDLDWVDDVLAGDPAVLAASLEACQQ
jgi:hypothetical protein